MSANKGALKKQVKNSRKIARESDSPIEKFFYFGKDGTVIEQEVGIPAYTQRRRRNAEKALLKAEGLPIPEELNKPISNYPRESYPVPLINTEAKQEPFEVPTKETTTEPWALIVPPTN